MFFVSPFFTLFYHRTGTKSGTGFSEGMAPVPNSENGPRTGPRTARKRMREFLHGGAYVPLTVPPP